MKRVLLSLVALVVIAIAGVLVYVDRIAGAAIERGATYALGVDTHVGFVRLSLLGGSFRLRGFNIRNPAGFDSMDFLDLGSARLDVSIDSLRGDTVVVPLFRLDEVDVALERSGGQTNYGVILNNLKRFETGKVPAGEPAAASGPEKRFVVHEIVITDVSARYQWSESLGDLGKVAARVPEIRLTNIGSEKTGGVVMAQLTDIILKAVLEAIAQSGGDLPGQLLGQLNSGLGGLTDVPGKLVVNLGSGVGEAVSSVVPGEVGDVGAGAVKGATQKVGEGAGKALKSVGGLFKRGSD